jgi:hypothetical protein
VLIQSPAGVALEVRDCTVRIAQTPDYDVYVCGSNVGRNQVPTTALTDFTDRVQHNPSSWNIQLIGFLGHDHPGVLGKAGMWILVTAAIIATRPIYPAAFVTWNPCSIAVES